MSTNESTEIWHRHSNLRFPIWVILASTHQFFFFLGAYLKIGPWTWIGRVWCLDLPEARLISDWSCLGPLYGHICPRNAQSPDKDPLLISHDLNPKPSSWNTKQICCWALGLLAFFLSCSGLSWKSSSWVSSLSSDLPTEPFLFLELWPAYSNHSTNPPRWAVPLLSDRFPFGPRFLRRI